MSSVPVSNILGMGMALPPHSVAQRDAAESALARCCFGDEQRQKLPIIYHKARVKRRGFVLIEEDGGDFMQGFYPPAESPDDRGPTTEPRMRRYSEEAPALARRAAELALSDAEMPAGAITHLVTVSCTGFEAPGFDVSLIKQLPLSPTVQRTHVGFMGCHGALNGLRVARAIADSQPDAVVLLVAAELCSLHFAYGWDPGQIVANALFADGAGALVVSQRVGGSQRSSRETWRVAGNAACIFPDSEHDMTWKIGDHGFVMTLSPRVPDLIAGHLRPWLSEWLATHDLTIGDVQSWAVHPGGPKILDAIEKCLELPSGACEVSRQVLSECGNMSSSTVLFILDRLRAAKAKTPCVSLGFGPGLAGEGALFL